MKPFRWSPAKNALLREERGVSFEEIVVAIEAGDLLQIVAHPNPVRYPRQKVLVVAVSGYAHLVPFVDESDHYWLKTIIPSRKATRDLLKGKKER